MNSLDLLSSFPSLLLRTVRFELPLESFFLPLSSCMLFLCTLFYFLSTLVGYSIVSLLYSSQFSFHLSQLFPLLVNTELFYSSFSLQVSQGRWRRESYYWGIQS